MINPDARCIRVLAADDSAVMRGILRRLFLEHGDRALDDGPAMDLCGVAHDGVECLEAMERLQPDVLLLDLEMPRLNGLQVLESLRSARSKVPVIMCSAHTDAGAQLTLNALALGAMDYVMKPSGQADPRAALRVLGEQLLPRIVAIARGDRPAASSAAGARLQRPQVRRKAEAEIHAAVIGVSTGGPTALEQILPMLPQDLPVPVLIAQHMPKIFTQALADRLDRCCRMRVRQAYEGAVAEPGTIWLAPGGANMHVARGKEGEPGSRDSGLARIHLRQQERLDHCTPSVDALFQSAAETFGSGTLAYVLTGMGEDGLVGSREIHRAGGTVVAQDEQSSAVWGMPAKVAHAGVTAAVLPLSAIAKDLLRRVTRSAGHPAAVQIPFESSNAFGMEVLHAR